MIFVITEIVCIPTGTSSALRKKKTGKESQYIVSRPELGSDPPFGSDRESGCDNDPSQHPKLGAMFHQFRKATKVLHHRVFRDKGHIIC